MTCPRYSICLSRKEHSSLGFLELVAGLRGVCPHPDMPRIQHRRVSIDLWKLVGAESICYKPLWVLMVRNPLDDSANHFTYLI